MIIADQSCRDPNGQLESPVIPHGYDRVAQWQMKAYGVTREQLAMCSVLMSRQAVRHPAAMCKKTRTLDEVLKSPQVAPVTATLECARRYAYTPCHHPTNGLPFSYDHDVVYV
jgi:acetyl-CoA acetyltransferase